MRKSGSATEDRRQINEAPCLACSLLKAWQCVLFDLSLIFFPLQLHQLKHLKSSRQDEAGLLAHPSKSTEAYSSLCPGRCLISLVSAASFLLKSRSSTKLLTHLAQSHFVVSMTRDSVSGNASLIINAMQWFSNLATCYNYFKCF